MGKKRGRFLLVASVLTFFWACGGPYYFDLHIEAPADQTGLLPEKVMRIEDVEINATYRNQMIVYRESPFQVKYYSFSLWSKLPEEMIEAAVLDFWRKRSLFKRVLDDDDDGDPNLTMRVRVGAIEKCYLQNHWQARLAIDTEILDSKSNEAILSHSFDRTMRLKGNNNRHLPEQISIILQEELEKIAAELRKKIE